jgi:hypothetical protein
MEKPPIPEAERMSPLLITLLIIGGVALLIAIAYINHLVENNRLERARIRADLNDRIRRNHELSQTLPGQLMSPQLKLLLYRLEQHFQQALLKVDKSNSDCMERIAELKQLVAMGELTPVNNPPQPVLNEAKAKDIRFLLEGLHAQISRGAKEGVISTSEAKQWLKETRHMLTQVHIEFFTNLGQQALQQGHPGQARLAFERGVQYLRKQQDPTPYQAALRTFEMQLERANALVLEQSKPSASEPSELTEGLKNLGDEDEWKKKNIYD